MQYCSQNTEMSVKVFIFSAVVGFHLASLLKMLTQGKNNLQRERLDLGEHLFLEQPLDGCFLQPIVEKSDKKSIKPKIYIYE